MRTRLLMPILAALGLALATGAAVVGADVGSDDDSLRASVEMVIATQGRQRIDFDVNQPPGRLIDVGGHRLHLFCIGQGDVGVLLDAGLGGFSLEWLKVQSDLAAETRVCSYDRAGYGWSDAGPYPRTTARIVNELHTLLERAGESGPWVLVGHSFGGYTMQMFAKQFAAEVAGLVLVDSSHPDQSQRLPARDTSRESRGYRRRMMSWPVVPPNFPYQARAVAYYLMHRPAAIRAQRQELGSFRTSGRQVALAGALPAVPVTVLSRGSRVWPENAWGDRMESQWQALQSELGPRGGRAATHVNAPFSGHYVHLDQPWLVEEAILDVLARARADARLSARSPATPGRR